MDNQRLIKLFNELKKTRFALNRDHSEAAASEFAKLLNASLPIDDLERQTSAIVLQLFRENMYGFRKFMNGCHHGKHLCLLTKDVCTILFYFGFGPKRGEKIKYPIIYSRSGKFEAAKCLENTTLPMSVYENIRNEILKESKREPTNGQIDWNFEVNNDEVKNEKVNVQTELNELRQITAEVKLELCDLPKLEEVDQVETEKIEQTETEQEN